MDVLFPKSCLNCQREGSYLCQDCQSLLDILESSFCLCKKPSRLPMAGKCRSCADKHLDGLYFAVRYGNNLVKKIIHRFKYEPYAKDLASPLAFLIITHFNLMQKSFDGDNCILLPIPLSKRKLRQRGYNQSEEIARVLSENLKIPLMQNCLFKNKETPSQMTLSREEREKNIKGAFSVNPSARLRARKILLVDDVYTTGATMEEAAKILKKAGAKEVWGISVAREE